MMDHRIELSELPMSELEAAVELATADVIQSSSIFRGGENAWVTFEAEVRSAASNALGRLRAHAGERCAELLRLCELEEQTRCQAFQAAMMGEVDPAVYQATVRSILEKLLGKLEMYALDPGLYQGAAQCLSEYMSALNHHCDICVVPRSPAPLPAIAEGTSRDEAGMSGFDSSDYPSEFGSEDAETLSVHSESTDGRMPRLSSSAPAHSLQLALGALGLSIPVGAEGLPARGGDERTSEEIRKERRREANKKASIKYRSKKANTMHQVLAESAATRQQVAALTSQNAVLTAENSMLKQQVAFLQGMLQAHGVGGAAVGAAAPAVAAGTVPAVGAASPAAAPQPLQSPSLALPTPACSGMGGLFRAPRGSAESGASIDSSQPAAPHPATSRLTAAGASPTTSGGCGGALSTASGAQAAPAPAPASHPVPQSRPMDLGMDLDSFQFGSVGDWMTNA
jgi:hypothetical protein